MSGCAPAPEPGLGFQIGFACADDGERADTVIVRIGEGPCPLRSAPLYEAHINRSSSNQAPSPGRMSAGSYAFEALALDAAGQKVAHMCQTVALPSATPLTLTLDGGGGCELTSVSSAGIHTNDSPSAPDAEVPNPSSSDSAVPVDDGPSEGPADPDASGGPTEARIVLERNQFLRGQAVPVRYVNVVKARKAFIAIYRDVAAEPLERFVVPFAGGAATSSGGHSFQALSLGSYVLRLMYDGKVVADEHPIRVVDDRDSDGTGDPDDGCPDDRLKVAPLYCGCGVLEGSDEDRDGIPDCADACPKDELKAEPGSCGCGFIESLGDRDNDGVSDCYDACPTDPSKVAPMVCGCGRPETDSDRDGTADCVDGCTSDATKIRPGLCGCGRTDQNTDGDGTPDCLDACPLDADKVAQGACGCGVVDKDSDGDRLPDCKDACPNDSTKVAAGVCGCGVPDSDSDADGTMDCRDGCPRDGAKRDAGLCGCGVSDADRDGDGKEDCHDGCPQDASKTSLGVCGCGNPDERDDNGTVICRLDPASCLEILTKAPSAADGTYLIDPDGRGAAMPMQVTCDMKKGGWTLIAREDFQSGQSSGWRAANGTATPVDRTSSCASALGPMLGGYNLLGGGGETRKNFDLFGIPHSEAWLTFDYVVLDSWEAEDALVYLDGSQQYSKTFDAKDAKANLCGGKKADHGPQKVDLKAAHAKSTLLVRVTSTLSSDASDESFGIANVVLRIR